MYIFYILCLINIIVKLEKNIDDTKYKLQLSAMTLNINDNKNNISSNLTKIKNNENSLSNNFENIDNFTQYILKSPKDFE